MMGDARGTTAAEIAEELNVSAATIRNRLSKLEEVGVIMGYHAHVDFDRIDEKLSAQFTCTVGSSDRERIARDALTIPGIVEARILMTGRRNLQVTVVGDDKDDLVRVSRALTNLGVDVESETLLQGHLHGAYEPYGPSDERRSQVLTDFVNLSGDAEIAEFTVTDDAPVAGMSIGEAANAGLIDESVLVVAVERGDAVITPKGDTTFEPEDVVTVFARRGSVESALDGITGAPPSYPDRMEDA